MLSTYPKFRHNLWTSFEERPDITYLTVSYGKFEVPRSEADEFLRIRGYCTGHHSVEDIARLSGLPLSRTREIIDSLSASDMLRRLPRPFGDLTRTEIIDGLLSATRIWAEQLRETHIAVEIFSGLVSRDVAIGWLLETYHYVKNFPDALQIAAEQSTGDLRDVLTAYCRQERGHEVFIEQSLVRLGLTVEEVRQSVPLVTTRLIDLLMRELFAAAPCAALLVAAVVEADEFEPEEIPALQSAFSSQYGSADDSLEPFFRHSALDAELGHGQLAERYAHLLSFENGEQLHDTINRLHDIKHAFDANKLEIKDYYGKVGNYLPRQKVDFFSI